MIFVIKNYVDFLYDTYVIVSKDFFYWRQIYEGENKKTVKKGGRKGRE